MLDDPTTGNKPVTGKSPLIRDTVVFTFGLGDVDSTVDLLGSLKNVALNWGTDYNPIMVPSTFPSQPPLPAPVPLPCAAVLGLVGLAAVPVARRAAVTKTA